MGFSRQENWSGLPFPPPGVLPNPGIKPASPALQVVVAEPLERHLFLNISLLLRSLKFCTSITIKEWPQKLCSFYWLWDKAFSSNSRLGKIVSQLLLAVLLGCILNPFILLQLTSLLWAFVSVGWLYNLLLHLKLSANIINYYDFRCSKKANKFYCCVLQTAFEDGILLSKV